MIDQELNTFVLTVHLSTGETREHVYPISSDQVQGIKEALDLMTRISNAFRTKVWFFPFNYNVLPLEHPSIIFNASYILYIEFMFRGPADWEKLINNAIKKPLGFKTGSG